MLRRFLLAIGFPILFVHGAYNLAGCAALKDAVTAKPTTYGAELAACDLQASTWEEYTPCCVDVATRYQRDPSFCFRGASDAGQPDGGASK